MIPVVREEVAGAAFALGDFIFVMREEEILAAGVRCFTSEQPEVLLRFLAEPAPRRETYFDVNLRRARVSFSLADLPGTIEQAFAAQGWIAW